MVLYVTKFCDTGECENRGEIGRQREVDIRRAEEARSVGGTNRKLRAAAKFAVSDWLKCAYISICEGNTGEYNMRYFTLPISG